MTPHTVNIVCAKAPVKVPCVPAVRGSTVSVRYEWMGEVTEPRELHEWLCSFCGARVKVVA